VTRSLEAVPDPAGTAAALRTAAWSRAAAGVAWTALVGAIATGVPGLMAVAVAADAAATAAGLSAAWRLAFRCKLEASSMRSRRAVTRLWRASLAEAALLALLALTVVPAPAGAAQVGLAALAAGGLRFVLTARAGAMLAERCLRPDLKAAFGAMPWITAAAGGAGYALTMAAADPYPAVDARDAAALELADAAALAVAAGVAAWQVRLFLRLTAAVSSAPTHWRGATVPAAPRSEAP
jgi:hypothetical protein